MYRIVIYLGNILLNKIIYRIIIRISRSVRFSQIFVLRHVEYRQREISMFFFVSVISSTPACLLICTRAKKISRKIKRYGIARARLDRRAPKWRSGRKPSKKGRVRPPTRTCVRMTPLDLASVSISYAPLTSNERPIELPSSKIKLSLFSAHRGVWDKTARIPESQTGNVLHLVRTNLPRNTRNLSCKSRNSRATMTKHLV